MVWLLLCCGLVVMIVDGLLLCCLECLLFWVIMIVCLWLFDRLLFVDWLVIDCWLFVCLCCLLIVILFNWVYCFVFVVCFLFVLLGLLWVVLILCFCLGFCVPDCGLWWLCSFGLLVTVFTLVCFFGYLVVLAFALRCLTGWGCFVNSVV